MNTSKFDKNGFTIVELIVASAISITVVSVGFFILEIALKGNKIDEAQRGLNSRLNDTLDFILDEVKVGRRIIQNELDITSLNSNCIYPESGEFLFGISLPDQALVKGDYNPLGEKFNLNRIECPIVYTIRPSNNNEVMPYSLIRYGPKYNEKGFYISPSFKEFQETVLLDGITSEQKYEKIVCPQGWNDIKTIKGVTFCIDQFKKSIELQIETEAAYKTNNENKIKSVASTGGFSLIQDETQVSLLPTDFKTNSNSPICKGVSCCWMGVCLKSNKITYMIDSSYFMNEKYDQHPNGSILNGKWTQINDPQYISPEINGKSLISTAVSSLKQHIYKLPTSNLVADGKKVFLQIIAFNDSSNLLFDDGPRELTIENKITALSFLDNLSAEVTSIEPWNELCSALESDSVGQIIILSASIPSKEEGYCAGTNGNYAEIINNYNRITRSKSPLGSLIIDSISLFHNFCEKKKNYYENNWLGLISSGEESVCTHIK
tara:strand:+ start:479 stop:1954 length:1476 start_codon:yes stop_codon:yes gene_type:complete